MRWCEFRIGELLGEPERGKKLLKHFNNFSAEERVWFRMMAKNVINKRTMVSNKKYSIAEAAKELGITRQTVHAAIRQKRLKAKRGTFTVERIVRTKIKGWMIDEKRRGNFIVDCC
jgi:excisionase family DNA binding protein